jgi:hypothetical protein
MLKLNLFLGVLFANYLWANPVLPQDCAHENPLDFGQCFEMRLLPSAIESSNHSTYAQAKYELPNETKACVPNFQYGYQEIS